MLNDSPPPSLRLIGEAEAKAEGLMKTLFQLLPGGLILKSFDDDFLIAARNNARRLSP